MKKRHLSISVLALALASLLRADQVTLADAKGEGGRGALYRIEGSFEVDATRSQVWRVLTDYSALKGVVSSMQASCVISREGNTVLVEQVALGHFLFFSKSIRLLLNVVEEPESGLRFSQASAKPFRVYDGSWTLEDKDGGVAVTYRLNVSRADMAPAFIERGLFKDNARSLLRELKAEIVRRAGLQAAAAKKSRS